MPGGAKYSWHIDRKDEGRLRYERMLPEKGVLSSTIMCGTGWWLCWASVWDSRSSVPSWFQECYGEFFSLFLSYSSAVDTKIYVHVCHETTGRTLTEYNERYESDIPSCIYEVNWCCGRLLAVYVFWRGNIVCVASKSWRWAERGYGGGMTRDELGTTTCPCAAAGDGHVRVYLFWSMGLSFGIDLHLILNIYRHQRC